MVRQWVEYYLVRIRTETQWDALSREQLQSMLEVSPSRAARSYNLSHIISYESMQLPATC